MKISHLQRLIATRGICRSPEGGESRPIRLPAGLWQAIHGLQGYSEFFRVSLVVNVAALHLDFD
ncbi:MAG: hypothetical protein AUJ57_07345 [Zetaproteobacteria bacterium CG1_02_53_45]|nr:MAG: hypothetical protein AUJ57_07345 [Zetaproteobacteria bacterium CG1_02_53_45]